MKNHIYAIAAILTAIFIFGCNTNGLETKLETNYNQKANELIQQIISQDSCNCITEIPKESMVRIKEMYQPDRSSSLKKLMMERLGVKSLKVFDSLTKLSDDFILDKEILAKTDVKLISITQLKKLWDNNVDTICFNTLCLQKPIFDKQYKNAIININVPFVCNSGIIIAYKFSNGKWVENMP